MALHMVAVKLCFIYVHYYTAHSIERLAIINTTTFVLTHLKHTFISWFYYSVTVVMHALAI